MKFVVKLLGLLTKFDMTSDIDKSLEQQSTTYYMDILNPENDNSIIRMKTIFISLLFQM